MALTSSVSPAGPGTLLYHGVNIANVLYGLDLGHVKSECRTLVNAVQHSLRLIEPWMHADLSSTSDVGTVTNNHLSDVLEHIRDIAGKYIYAIELSTQVTQDCIGICEDALLLCEFIRENKPKADIRAFIGSMITLAEGACGRADAMLKQFQIARLGFVGASITVTSNVVKTTGDINRYARSKKMYEFTGSACKKVASVLSPNGVVETITMAIPDPHITIIIPILLPLVRIAVEKTGEWCTTKAEKREVQRVSCEEARKRWVKIQESLNSLLAHMHARTLWWRTILDRFLRLRGIENVGVSMSGPTNERIKERWAGTIRVLRAHVSHITLLQDYYPIECTKPSEVYEHSHHPEEIGLGFFARPRTPSFYVPHSSSH